MYMYTCTCVAGHPHSTQKQEQEGEINTCIVFPNQPKECLLTRLMYKKLYDIKLSVSVPLHSVFLQLSRFVLFRLPRANRLSARREFLGKIHCARWRSIASVTMVFNDYTKRWILFYHEKGYWPRHIALFIARVRGLDRRFMLNRSINLWIHMHTCAIIGY